MRVLSLCLCVFVFWRSVVLAAYAPDEVSVLPGWSGPLPSRWYSGLVNAGAEEGYQMYEHYIYIEAENDPTTAPIVLWTNGGPGASSLFGLFIELGPFYLDDGSLKTKSYNETGVPSLFYNEFTWNRNANLLILNSPPPVGFSYCDPAGPSGDGYSCGNWNDTRTAKHNKIFIDNFVRTKFPELGGKDREWYLTGESYAGVYVPTLAREFLDDPSPSINLRGFAVGDPCAGTDVVCGNAQGPLFTVEFFHGHGQFSDKLYRKIQKDCPYEQLAYGVTDTTCLVDLKEMNAQIGGYYAYALYDECTYENLGAMQLAWQTPSPYRQHVQSWLRDRMHSMQERKFFSNSRLPSSHALVGNVGYPCGGNNALGMWVNSTAVRSALHVALDSNFFSGDNGVGFNYTLTEKNLLPFYRALANGYKGSMTAELKVLVYNGDTDPCINSFNTQNWTAAVGQPETEAWRPWTIDGKARMGGYVTRYATDGAGSFDFLTIRGSGHMVPEYEPRSAKTMLEYWLSGEPWPYYLP